MSSKSLSFISNQMDNLFINLKMKVTNFFTFVFVINAKRIDIIIDLLMMSDLEGAIERSLHSGYSRSAMKRGIPT